MRHVIGNKITLQSIGKLLWGEFPLARSCTVDVCDVERHPEQIGRETSHLYKIIARYEEKIKHGFSI